MTQTIVVVGGSCLLFGGLLGWIFGHAAGFVDGREVEKQNATEKTVPRI